MHQNSIIYSILIKSRVSGCRHIIFIPGHNLITYIFQISSLPGYPKLCYGFCSFTTCIPPGSLPESQVWCNNYRQGQSEHNTLTQPASSHATSRSIVLFNFSLAFLPGISRITATSWKLPDGLISKHILERLENVRSS